MDAFQERYLDHQEKKALSLKSDFGTPDFKKYTAKEKDAFFEIITNRRSQRIFNTEPITEYELEQIKTAINLSPTSCGRKGISYQIITERHDKEILSGLLVGGIGWINRANIIILLNAFEQAYKAPGEIYYMPYLDTGVIAQSVYLTAEALNIGCCFVNPNIREENKDFFKHRFTDNFTGALILGKYDKKST